MNQATKDRIVDILKPQRLDLVNFDSLEGNHYDDLGRFDSEHYLLFVNRISRDNFLVFEFERYRNQVMTTGKVEESHSNNFIPGRECSYYLTIEQMRAVLECMEIIQELK